MSDSLKDQLLKAGFTETTPARKEKRTQGKTSAKKKQRASSGTNAGRPRKNTHHKTSNPAGKSAANSRKRQTPVGSRASVENVSAEEIAKRKAIKAQIKKLIEENCVKEFTGEIAYSYQLGARLKQLFVNNDVHTRLAADELVITRLNGNTHIITPELVDQILTLNADWAIIRNADKSKSEQPQGDGYEDYQIPDDLIW